MIYEIRGKKVILDRDLARLYRVETKVLNQAVKRNSKRFPEDFMFQLNLEEYMPYAFTEQGVAMLSSILRSETAIAINIRIMRTFVSIRQQIYARQSISAELEAIRAKLSLLERNDEDNLEAINDLSEDVRREIDNIYQAIAALSVKEPQPRPRKIGFKTGQ